MNTDKCEKCGGVVGETDSVRGTGGYVAHHSCTVYPYLAELRIEVAALRAERDALADSEKLTKARLETAWAERDAAVAKWEAVMRVIGEIGSQPMYFHPGWCFDGRTETVVAWIKDDYELLRSYQGENMRALADNARLRAALTEIVSLPVASEAEAERACGTMVDIARAALSPSAAATKPAGTGTDEAANLREAWYAARQCLREMRAAQTWTEFREILTAYDQRNHENAPSPAPHAEVVTDTLREILRVPVGADLLANAAGLMAAHDSLRESNAALVAEAVARRQAPSPAPHADSWPPYITGSMGIMKPAGAPHAEAVTEAAQLVIDVWQGNGGRGYAGYYMPPIVALAEGREALERLSAALGAAGRG